MQRQEISRTSSSDESNDSSLSRVLIRSAEQTSEHTLPLSIIPSSTSIETTRRTIHTQTTQENQSSYTSKSNPSFAETQLLSVYYLDKNPKTPILNDKCIFVEQQDRQPVRYRAAYDPLSLTKATQTLLITTHDSSLIVNKNQQINSNNEHISSNKLSEESKYSFEKSNKYFDETENRTLSSSSSSSSVTTVIAQNEKLDSEQTTHLNLDKINTHSITNNTSINHEKLVNINNQRISSWPPVPDDILLMDNQHDNNEIKRPSRVQFAENLVHIIPVSTTNSLNEESIPPPPPPPSIIPRTIINEKNELTNINSSSLTSEHLQQDNSHLINQSQSIKTHIDNTDNQLNKTSRRVDKLRLFFEQSNNHSSDSSTLNSSINSLQQIESEETSSKYGDKIRFRINDSNTSNIYHAEPAKIIQYTKNPSIIIKQNEQSTLPFKLEQIQQITGKQFKNFDDIGHILPDGHTWQWNEMFWLSLTPSQRDQLQELERRIYSRSNSFENSLNQNNSDLSSSSSNETKQYKSTINTTEIVSKQQHTLSDIKKSSEINTKTVLQESINQQQILTSKKRTDSQLTITESGYSSPDDLQRLRSSSNTIIEESSSNHIELNNDQKNLPEQQTKMNPLSYEQFIYDYLSTYARPIRSNNGTLILIIDEQQINMSHICLPSTNDKLILAKNIYIDSIDQYPLPFETELNQLIIFINEESIIIPTDRWIFYREKYHNTQWIQQLKRVNRNIPSQLIPIIEQWLSDHATISLNTHELNIDGLIIPLIGRLGLHILDLYEIRQLQTNYWNELYKYLIHIGCISYNSNEKLIYIANSELDARNILTTTSSSSSCEIFEHLIKWLNELNEKNFIIITEQNNIIIYPKGLNNQEEQIFIYNQHIDTYMKKKSNQIQSYIINMNDLAHILFLYNYVQYSSGQLIFSKQDNNNQLLWLQSIIHSIQLNEQKQITEIELYDGENIQKISIPYEYMFPTQNQQIIANYLLQNGHIRYDINTENYAYSYISLNDKSHHYQLLSSHIKCIHIDKINKNIQIEFIHDTKHYLQIPLNWYEQIFEHNFNRFYIIDMLFKNNGIINQDNFIFNNQSYSLKSLISYEEKVKLINHYIEHINNHNGIKYDKTNNILLLENPLDNSQLYLTCEHTEFIHKNQYKKQDVKDILIKSSEINQDDLNNYLLYYNNQCIKIPLLNNNKYENQNELIDHYHKIIHYMYNHNLIIYNKNSKLIQIYFSNQILTIPINELELIINKKIFHSSNYNNILPFNTYDLSQWLLKNCEQIKYLNNNTIELIYKNNIYILPLINHVKENNLPFKKSSSITSLDIEQSNKINNYSIDPLLLLANYIYHSSTIYQDELDRLVIKLNNNEIVIPHIDSINSIQAINTSPTRIGTIIAHLIDRIGKVQSNKLGGIIITIGKNSFELSKEILNYSNKNTNNNNIKSNHYHSTKSPILPLLKHSKSSSNLLSSSSSSHIEHPSFNDDQQILYIKDNRSITSDLNSTHSNSSINSQTSLYLKPRLIIISDDKQISTNTTRFYIQYTYENDSTQNINSNSIMMLPNQYPIQPTQPKLIAPQHYRNIALRQAPVYIYEQNHNEIIYENLAQYLSTKQTDLSSYTVRRMLKFTSRDEYLNYLSKKMSVIQAEQLVQQSEDSLLYSNKDENNLNQQRSRSPGIYYNVQNGTMINESNISKDQQNRYYFSSKSIDRSPSSSSLGQSPQIINGQILLTPEKNVTLPRSATLSGQSNDGESESRTTVSRSASAAAKVITSKSDTIKSTTSSSAASSREHSTVLSSAIRAQTLASPNRTNGSKSGGGDEVKKEKKSKFRTPSFLRKRKEKKETAHKDKN